MLAQEGALGELVQQHLMSQRKFGQLSRHNNRVGRPSIKTKSDGGSYNDRSPKTPTKRRRSGGGSGRKKHRKKK
jgi:hypothetical protein